MATPPKAVKKSRAKTRKNTSRGRPPQPAPLKAAKEALTRQHIMDVAESVFAEQGFAGAKMQDIAKASGLSLTTLYQAFPGKEELHRAVLIARDQEMLQAALAEGQALLSTQGGVKEMLAVLAAQLRYLLEHPDYLRLQLQAGHAWYHSASRPSSDEQQMWERGLAIMEQVFRWGTDAGWFIPGTPADQARLLMAMQQARLENWVADGMQEAHASVISRIQADFVRQFCRPEVARAFLSEDGAQLAMPYPVGDCQIHAG